MFFAHYVGEEVPSFPFSSRMSGQTGNGNRDSKSAPLLWQLFRYFCKPSFVFETFKFTYLKNNGYLASNMEKRQSEQG